MSAPKSTDGSVAIINPTTLQLSQHKVLMPIQGSEVAHEWLSRYARKPVDIAKFHQFWHSSNSELLRLLAEDLGVCVKHSERLCQQLIQSVSDVPHRSAADQAMTLVRVACDPLQLWNDLLLSLPGWLAGHQALQLAPSHNNAWRLAEYLCQLFNAVKPDSAILGALSQTDQSIRLQEWIVLPELTPHDDIAQALIARRTLAAGQAASTAYPHSHLGTDALVQSTSLEAISTPSKPTRAGAHVLFVADAQLDNWTEALHTNLAELIFGNPLDKHSDVGPLLDKASIRRVEDQVPRAILKRMGRLVMGGRQFRPSGLSGYFFQPTLLLDVSADSPIVNQPIHAPVMVLNPLSRLTAWIERLAMPNLVERIDLFERATQATELVADVRFACHRAWHLNG